jgi:hypothetical protein
VPARFDPRKTSSSGTNAAPDAGSLLKVSPGVSVRVEMPPGVANGDEAGGLGSEPDGGVAGAVGGFCRSRRKLAMKVIHALPQANTLTIA